MPKIISIAIPKGGVGKTSTAVNLAASLAVLEKKTLLIDIDPAGACSVSFNITQDKTRGGSFDLFGFKKSLDQVVHPTLLENLDFIPSNVFSYEDEEKLNRLTSNIGLLKNILDQQILPYDFIIIDCPPYLHGMSNLGLTASKSVIFPVRSASFSIKALQKILVHLEWIKKNYNKDLRIEGILHTMYESRTRASALTETQLYEIVGKYVFKTRIPKSTAIAESTFYGKPAVLFNVSSSGSKAYLALAKEIIVRNRVCPFVRQEKNLSLQKLSSELPTHNSLMQNYPNPFGKHTKIAFTVNKPAKVKLDVFSLRQEKIESVFSNILSPGKYEYTWEPPNSMPSGVYNYRIEIDGYTELKKLIYSKG